MNNFSHTTSPLKLYLIHFVYTADCNFTKIFIRGSQTVGCDPKVSRDFIFGGSRKSLMTFIKMMKVAVQHI